MLIGNIFRTGARRFWRFTSRHWQCAGFILLAAVAAAPRNVTISIGGFDPATGQTFASNAGGDVTIDPNAIAAALQSSNVAIQSNNQTYFFANNAQSSGSGSLTLQSGGVILMTLNTHFQLTGAFNAVVNDAGAIPAYRSAGQAQFYMNNASSITAFGGITISSGSLVANSSGGTTVAANTGDPVLTNLTTTPTTAGASAGNISVSNNFAPGKNIMVSGTLDARGADNPGGRGGNGGNITLVASGDLQIGAVNTAAGSGTPAGSPGDVTFQTGGTLSIGGSLNVGAFTLNTPGQTTLSGPITGSVLRLLGNGPYTLNNAGNHFQALAATTTGNFSYADAGALVVLGVTAPGFSLNSPSLLIFGVGAAINAQNISFGASSGTQTITFIDVRGPLPANVINGSVNFTSPVSITLALTGAYVPQVGDTFHLIAGAITGTMPTFSLPTLPAGRRWDTSNFASTGSISVLAPPVVVSELVHGSAGAFDINLPFTGTPAVECRSGGASGVYQIIFYFPRAVTFGGASVSSGAGNVASSSGNGTGVIVANLTGVANAQRITVTLTNVNDGGTPFDVTVPMGVLLGDTNGDGVVNSGDALQTRNRSGQVTDATNFRSDVNLDGFINSGDSTIVRSRSGTSLP
ncbi:MAG: dockerin type I domain-containing protein [Verrucomicrobiota bacterium]|nr:dockerin type I domain-containing protein [Verrucomicrobiota bacterium]